VLFLEVIGIWDFSNFVNAAANLVELLVVDSLQVATG